MRYKIALIWMVCHTFPTLLRLFSAKQRFQINDLCIMMSKKSKESASSDVTSTNNSGLPLCLVLMQQSGDTATSFGLNYENA